jgi:hypothetical protein
MTSAERPVVVVQCLVHLLVEHSCMLLLTSTVCPHPKPCDRTWRLVD